MSRLFISVLLVGIGVVVGAVVSLDLKLLPNGQAEEEKPPPPILKQVPAEGELTFVSIANIVTPAVVNISSIRVIKRQENGKTPFFNDPFFRRFFGDDLFQKFQLPQQHREQSLGSGVIIDPRGFIVTNNHVIEQASEIKVVLSDRREFKGRLVGSDPKSDIAVIKVEADEDLPFARWGDSDQLQVGEYVLAIGNPFGLNQTVTMGIISAVGRANMGIADYEDFIQTDAAINPGNSGGALVNSRAEVIGVNTAIFTRTGGYQGIGFAVPSNMAKLVITSLMETGKVIRGWLGVSIQEISPALGKEFGVKELKGALVSDVFPNSPAEKAGFQRGDIVFEFRGKMVKSVGQLRNLVSQTLVGSKVEVKLLRDRKEKILTVNIGELPNDLAEVQVKEAKRSEADNVLNSLEVQGLDPGIILQLELPNAIQGVIISNVVSGSFAEASGLRRGDIIQEIDRRKLRSLKDYHRMVSKIKKNDMVLLLVFRDDRTFFVTVSPE